ncbi:hypothetical protein BGZ61DRAFT_9949 [Ilyonectria robusta]|uniref:uncharacterized protein n=1 Tax=Ilyonectria robusta TaxID=1079257 RepID=UPI001E8E9808|nr:uncharacterized protein BGZ61DRAFT_9949 [Ilyonectria robusta]KAH8737142.1 hypothetical protein BGZ61DRAFT_9949 [Ilyonectria robusta]
MDARRERLSERFRPLRHLAMQQRAGEHEREWLWSTVACAKFCWRLRLSSSGSKIRSTTSASTPYSRIGWSGAIPTRAANHWGLLRLHVVLYVLYRPRRTTHSTRAGQPFGAIRMAIRRGMDSQEAPSTTATTSPGGGSLGLTERGRRNGAATAVCCACNGARQPAVCTAPLPPTAPSGQPPLR